MYKLHVNIIYRIRANSRHCWPHLARSFARSLVHERVSVPRSATYVTNVRYSLGESRVRYVKSAVTLRAYVWRALRHRGTRERQSARMQHATTLRIVGRKEHIEAPPEHRSARIATDRDNGTRNDSQRLMKCRGRISSFKFETKILIQECHRF